MIFYFQVDLTKESLLKQFKIVKKETNTSHVIQYGDLVGAIFCFFGISAIAIYSSPLTGALSGFTGHVLELPLEASQPQDWVLLTWLVIPATQPSAPTKVHHLTDRAVKIIVEGREGE